MALESLSYAEFTDEMMKRLDGTGISRVDAKKVLKAFEEEVIDCAANGYKVSVPGFVRFQPRYVAAKRKGEMVRNPTTGETAPRAVGVPASFKLKAFVSSSAAKRLPDPARAAGKNLKAMLEA